MARERELFAVDARFVDFDARGQVASATRRTTLDPWTALLVASAYQHLTAIGQRTLVPQGSTKGDA